jgi:hypothetical protein
MAVAYQAAGTPVSGTGDLTVAWPAHLSGDVGFLVVESADEAVSTPSGWTACTGSPGTGSSLTRCSVFWRRATSAAESDVTVTDPGDHALAVIVTARGAFAGGDPVNAGSGGTETFLDPTYQAGGVTSTADNCLIFTALATSRDDTTLPIAPAALTGCTATGTAVSVSVATGNGGGLWIGYGTKATAGSCGQTTYTHDAVTAVDYVTLAIKPDTGSAAFFAMF